jgi:hypothetical protein
MTSIALRVCYRSSANDLSTGSRGAAVDMTKCSDRASIQRVRSLCRRLLGEFPALSAVLTHCRAGPVEGIAEQKAVRDMEGFML